MSHSLEGNVSKACGDNGKEATGQFNLLGLEHMDEPPVAFDKDVNISVRTKALTG